MKKKRKGMPMAFLCGAVLLFGMTAQPLAMQTSAAAAILMDADSGRVLYENNTEEERLIASTTKIMTALVAIENCDLDDEVEIKKTHMAEGSSMYLVPGERISLEELLYGLMLSSGNDAALAVADHCGPGISAFVGKMNGKAKELGLLHTSFANPNGLDAPEHYSSARDLATLTAYAMKNETFSQIVSTKRITIGERSLVNHNKLLSQCQGCIGVKTGYTRAAGRALVSCTVRDGLKLIAVTLDDRNDWSDHKGLYEEGFSRYHAEHPAIFGDAAARLPVLNGKKQEVPVVYGGNFSYPVAREEKFEVQTTLADCCFAPVKAGSTVGEAVFILNGKEIGRVPLLAGEAVESLPRAAQEKTVWSRISGFFRRSGKER